MFRFGEENMLVLIQIDYTLCLGKHGFAGKPLFFTVTD